MRSAPALALASMVWTLIERFVRPLRPALAIREATLPFAHAAAYLAVALWVTWIVISLATLEGQIPFRPDLTRPLGWIALVSLLASLIAFWWDDEAAAAWLPERPTWPWTSCP